MWTEKWHHRHDPKIRLNYIQSLTVAEATGCFLGFKGGIPTFLDTWDYKTVMQFLKGIIINDQRGAQDKLLTVKLVLSVFSSRVTAVI